MKPFYSINELAKLLDEDIYTIADGLIASGVPMLCEGMEADVSGWRRPVTTAADGSIFVTTEMHPVPPPEYVIVSSETLPCLWKQIVSDNTNTTEAPQDNSR